MTFYVKQNIYLRCSISVFALVRLKPFMNNGFCGFNLISMSNHLTLTYWVKKILLQFLDHIYIEPNTIKVFFMLIFRDFLLALLDCPLNILRCFLTPWGGGISLFYSRKRRCFILLFLACVASKYSARNMRQWRCQIRLVVCR